MSENPRPGLYYGHVTHVRTSPKRHSLNYRIYSLLLDLDKLDAISRKLKFFSVDRFNLFSFYRKDRGDGSILTLRQQIEKRMAEAGVSPDGGPIMLMTMPRLMGWSFNPLSIYFCYTRAGLVSAIFWEVDNTFGERHGYLIPAEPMASAKIEQSCDKEFYVSPFIDMNMRYNFDVRPPTETFFLKIDVSGEHGHVLTARHIAHRHELTDRALLAAFFKIPFLTLKVIGGIHWEALKIRLKGIRFRTRPSPPMEPVTVVRRRSR